MGKRGTVFQVFDNGGKNIVEPFQKVNALFYSVKK